MQSRGNGVLRSKTSQFPFATRFIKGHDLFLGNLLKLAKKNPSPRFSLNPHITIDVKTGRLKPSKEMIAITSELDVMLSGRISDTNIIDDEMTVNMDEVSSI